MTSVLLLRSTRANRALAIDFEELMRAAYPALTGDAVASLMSPDRPWPGSAVIWAEVASGTSRLLLGPPRGIRLGR